MNIIKFKDTYITDQDWYNSNLRGKYAYWVRCRYVVPLDAIAPNMYVSYETTINNLLAYDYYVLTVSNSIYSYTLVSIGDITENQMRVAVLVEEIPSDPTSESPVIIKIDNSTVTYVDLWDGDYNWINSQIDYTGTDSVNDVNKYIVYNEHVPSGEITLDQLKHFRTWIAESLLSLGEYSENDTHMLEYYAGGMTDDIIKWLTQFGTEKITINQPSTSSCGCVGAGSNLSSLYNDSVSICDPIALYRSNVRAAMITLFSDITTWTDLPSSFLAEAIQYLEGIITANLPLASTSTPIDIYSCDCLKVDDLAQASAQTMLRELIGAFTYMIEGKVDGHKNSIANALSNWSVYLYEQMEWV